MPGVSRRVRWHPAQERFYSVQMTNRLIGYAFLAVLFLGAAACSDSDGTPVDTTQPGPYEVGVATYSLSDREVEVWYPAFAGASEGLEKERYYIRRWLPPVIDGLLDPDADPPFVTDAYRDLPPAESGTFPVVVFAHGYSAFRNQSTFLTTFLASHGMVVVAPDYLERGLASALGFPPEGPRDDVEVTQDALDTLASALPQVAEIGDFERMGIVGHSAGGGTALRVASAWPELAVYIPMTAGASREPGDMPATRSLWVAGGIDASVSVDSVRNGYQRAAAPKRYLSVENAGHLLPSDLCAIGAEDGGIIEIAKRAGLPVPANIERLGTDGCQEEALAAELGWAVVRDAVTSVLLESFGALGDAPVLGADVVERYPSIPIDYREEAS